MNSDTCTLLLTLRPVVTQVQRRNGHILRAKDFPPGSWYEIPALCVIFGVSRRRIWNMLSEHRAELQPPTYRQPLRHRGTMRRHRVINQADFEVLEQYLRSQFEVSEHYLRSGVVKKIR